MRKLLTNSRYALDRLRENLFKRLFRARFRYDIFLSYSQLDSKEYAASLKQQLEKLDFSCFIDKEESPPGSSLDPTLAKALKKSAVLVLLATERALTRPYVVSEFKKFAATGRTIVPINIKETLSKNDEEALTKSPWNIIKERKLVWIDEIDEAFTKKNPSPAIADGIDKLFKYTRRNVRVRTEMIGTAALVLVALLGAGLVIRSQAAEVSRQFSAAELAKKDAADQLEIAKTARAETKRERDLAKAASDEAQLQEERANSARKEAERQQEIARKATYEAEKQQELARLAKLEADKQQRLANANELANRAVVSRSEEPQAIEQSVTDSSKAVSEFVALKTTSTNADYALRSTASLLHPRVAKIPFDRDNGRSSVDALALSPDGKYVALAGNSLNICTVAAAPKCTSQLVHYVDKLAFTPDQQHLTTISKPASGTTVTMWRDWHTENPIAIKTVNYSSQQFAFSADGGYLAAVAGERNDKEVSVDVLNTTSATERSSHRLSLAEGQSLTAVLGVAVSGNGRFLALSLVVNVDDMLVQVWDLLSKTVIADIPTFSKQLNDEQNRRTYISRIALSNDGSKLAIKMSELLAAENAVFVWDVKYFRIISQIQLRSDDPDILRFSPDGTYLATNSKSGVARMWEVERGTEIARFTQPSHDAETSIKDIAFSSNGKFFGLSPESYNPILAQVWNISSITLDAPFRWRRAKAILSNNGKYLATLGEDDMKIWDVPEHKLLPAFFESAASSANVVFSPNERFVALADRGRWRIFDVIDKSEQPYPDHTGTPVFSLNGEYLVSDGIGRELKIFKVGNTRAIARIPKKEENFIAALSPKGKYVAVAAQRARVAHILTVTESEDLLNDQPHASPVSSKDEILEMVWSPNERYVAVIDLKGNVTVFDPLKNSVVVRDEPARPSLQLHYSADSRYLVVPGKTQNVIVFDVKNGYKRFELSLTSMPEVLAITPDSKHLAVTLNNLTVEVWDLTTRQRINHIRLENKVTSMAFSQDAKYLVVLMDRQMVAQKLLWRPKDLLAEAHRRLPGSPSQPAP
jgi:WD40 repeat protein